VQLVSKEIWVINGQLLSGSVSVVDHGCPLFQVEREVMKIAKKVYDRQTITSRW
jgi:hypothetical protein